MTITVHHLENSRSHRILWMLEELGLPYEIEVYRRDRNLRAPPQLRHVHPLGRAPVVSIDDLVLAESGAILEHFADAHGLRPEAGTEAHRHYRYWMHYAEGSLMPPLLVRLIGNQIRDARVPFFVKPIARRIAGGLDDAYTAPALAQHLGFVDDFLADNAYFAGSDFSAADIQMSYPVQAGLGRGGVEGLTHMQRWWDEVSARPAYQRAEERGGENLA